MEKWKLFGILTLALLFLSFGTLYSEGLGGEGLSGYVIRDLWRVLMGGDSRDIYDLDTGTLGDGDEGDLKTSEGEVCDMDSDGYISYNSCQDSSCSGYSSCVNSEYDCNDDDASVNILPNVCGVEVYCNNGIDDDGDGGADCNDPDCDGQIGCGGELIETDCSNNVDDDYDFLTDCADPDCAGSPDCPPGDYGLEDCFDQFDNDGDGLVDCNDLDCIYVCDGTRPIEECNNNIDDDADGLVDCEDLDDCESLEICDLLEDPSSDTTNSDTGSDSGESSSGGGDSSTQNSGGEETNLEGGSGGNGFGVDSSEVSGGTTSVSGEGHESTKSYEPSSSGFEVNAVFFVLLGLAGVFAMITISFFIKSIVDKEKLQVSKRKKAYKQKFSSKS